MRASTFRAFCQTGAPLKKEEKARGKTPEGSLRLLCESEAQAESSRSLRQ